MLAKTLPRRRHLFDAFLKHGHLKVIWNFNKHQKRFYKLLFCSSLSLHHIFVLENFSLFKNNFLRILAASQSFLCRHKKEVKFLRQDDPYR